MSDQEKQQHAQQDQPARAIDAGLQGEGRHDETTSQRAAAFGAAAAESSGPPAVSPGAVLAAQRRARGWSVEYVASHLKLAIRQIHALEEDHYAALPGAVVTRGFIRIYAKMLELDPAPLVAGLPVDSVAAGSHAGPGRTLSTPFSETSLPLRGRHELPVTALLWLGVGVIVVAGLFAASRYGAWEQFKSSALAQRLHLGNGAAAADIDPAAEPGSKPLAVADSENAVPLGTTAAEESPPAAAATDATVDNRKAVQPSVAAPMPSPVVVPAPVATPVAPVAAAAPVAASAAAKNTIVAATPPGAPAAPAAAVPAAPLQLTVHQDSWVEIRRNSDKRTMISRVLKAGSNETFDITEPVTLIVGNVAGVDATLRGQSLELGSTSGTNVARLNLK